MDNEVICTRIKATENTTLAKLTVLDQIKMLISSFSNNDAAELDAREKLSVGELRKKASLNLLLTQAADAMKERGSNSVTLAVSSSYLPYIDEVIDPIYGLGRYYKFEIYKKKLPFNVNYNMVVRMSRRVTGLKNGG